ncbi:multidrug ABC transporter substrate-binding protein [Rhodoferax koreense]|uniref:Multidrug ABC transporter substrate-binding protein n=1 Tax=Rhodoferax koreensis TaxID=1842727 RepID=A0A1P8JWZ3_9BURK|nr:FtsX-like permease family protein [Rhodoferax koreense]APW38221.1 multidrug ABC transporter substrate-binding protein [Rhodoferax koreense]
MQIIAIAIRYLWSRPLAATLNLLLLALGLASITFVWLASTQMDRSFERDLAGIDAVVGAKGSAMQLILAGVFHIDVPTGNIPLAAVRELEKDPRVAKLIPISLGDTFQGFRIAGTTTAYVAHYGAQLAQGALWTQPMQAVIGAQVAQNTGLAVGNTFYGSHGLGGSGHVHGDFPYLVSGVLAPCGCVLDRLVLTATESVWRVHEKATALDAEDQKIMEEEREVTLALITYRSPLAAVSFPRFVNTTTEMQAAAPAVEITRLLRMVGVGTDVLRGFGAVLLLTAGLSVFIALWNAVRERRADLAMLRMLGAPPAKVAGLVLAEALLLAAMATVLGLFVGHLLAEVVGHWLQAERSLPLTGWIWLPVEWWLPALGAAVAVLAAALPAIEAYRLDVTTLLNTR